MVDAGVSRLDSAHCSAVLHPDFIEYIFHSADKAAVDSFISLMDRVLALRYPAGFTGTVRLIYDSRTAGVPPLFWLFTRGVEWRMRHPAYAPSQVRMALLYPANQRFHDSFLFRMAEQFQWLFTHSSHRFGLSEDDRQAAIDWLMSAEADDHLRDALIRPF